MPRRHFGTDGVRGIVGDDLTPDLVEQIGKAATLWSGGGCVLVGRDTRSSGPELETAVARGIASAGGTAVLGGVLPTPAVALLADGLGIVISASHNPPEYNGVKVFRDGGKLVDEQEEEIEALLDAASSGGGSVEQRTDAREAYTAHVTQAFGSDLSGLRVGVDCANGAFADIAPGVFEHLGADVHAIGTTPDGSNINVGCGATDLRALQQTVTSRALDLGVAFDGDGDRMLAVDERGEPIDGDQILAVLALALGVDVVAVTVMTNLGFHRLMAEHRIKVVTTPVGDRYVLEALRREGGLLGGEQSGHVISLGGHVTGDGLASALLLCRSLGGRRLSEAAGVMPHFPQVIRNIAVSRRDVPLLVLDEVDRMNAELGDGGRVLVRASGTEPMIRVLAEAENAADAERLCASIAALVERELG
ncbi:MAG TPA: phosphoglucosamine mutase [Gaiellaceae bacterium]|nr:phosphoglucosamine mutase [Gaiellaceae bacterium]